MISLKRPAPKADEGTAQSWPEVAAVLVRSAGLHAIPGDPADRKALSVSIQKLAEAAERADKPTEVVTLAGAMARALETYATRTGQLIRERETELYGIAAAIAQVLMDSPAVSETNAGHLGEMVKQLGAAPSAAALREVRTQLADCLQAVGRELTAVRTGGSAAGAPGDTGTAPRAEGIDSVTGLPDSTAAETAIERASTEEGWYLAVMVAARVHLVNQRFGYTVGDEMIRSVHKLITPTLRPEDTLFRWRGPAFVALLKRRGPLAAVQVEFNRLSSAKLERSFESNRRSVLLSVGINWRAFEVTGAARAVMQNIDSFVASQTAV